MSIRALVTSESNIQQPWYTNSALRFLLLSYHEIKFVFAADIIFLNKTRYLLQSAKVCSVIHKLSIIANHTWNNVLLVNSSTSLPGQTYRFRVAVWNKVPPCRLVIISFIVLCRLQTSLHPLISLHSFNRSGVRAKSHSNDKISIRVTIFIVPSSPSSLMWEICLTKFS